MNPPRDSHINFIREAQADPSSIGPDLQAALTHALADYLHHLDGQAPAPLYDMVIREVERPLFAFVLEHAQGNQSVAARLLGINRNTLRRKLLDYALIRGNP
jgi:Fis family transcriptional regulator, factor for inversion stimulation protein